MADNESTARRLQRWTGRGAVVTLLAAVGLFVLAVVFELGNLATGGVDVDSGHPRGISTALFRLSILSWTVMWVCLALLPVLTVAWLIVTGVNRLRERSPAMLR